VSTVTNWFHCWVGPGSDWREPVEEHLQALARAGFDGKFKVGIVGPHDTRVEALDLIAAQRSPDRVVEADEGWEQHTLRLVRAEAKRALDGLTLYTHTKGASHGTGQMSHWRRSMTVALLKGVRDDGDWRSHVRSLALFEAVGCHWLDELPSGGRGFAGNFWLARNSFLATLPPVASRARHDAESWIGSGDRPPALIDLNPGYPGTVSWVEAIGWPR
jgi:hypothetical protein